MKRVCHIVQSYYPGDPRVRRESTALVDAGFRVDVICLRDKGTKPHETISGVRVFRVPLSRQRGNAVRYLFEYVAFFFLVSFLMLLRARRYDVIHVSNLPDCLVFSTIVPKLLGAKVLLDEHDPMAELFMLKYHLAENSFVTKLLNLQERLSVRYADCVLTVNDAMQQRIQRAYKGIPVSIVMNLPESEVFKPVKGKWLESQPDDKFCLLFCGTVSKNYDLAMVINAMVTLRSRIPGVCLNVVGDGDEIPSLSSLAEERGVADIVTFHGRVLFDKIPDIIAGSDIGISTLRPSVIADLCFYTKTAEYVMAGLPSVAARAQVVERYFPQKTVQFFEIGDQASFEEAVIHLYENPELRTEMSRLGIEFSKGSNWSVEKQKYIDLIASLCSGVDNARLC